MKVRQKSVIGTVNCLCCGKEIPARVSENGTLNLSCHWCDFPAYARKGTEAHGRLMGKVTKYATPEPEKVPKDVPEAAPAPKAPIAGRSVFDLMRGA
ncbi:hypothetical protein [Pandoraea sp. SD6-2]|uniref:hypothetical protein n=1 Tax=Pandoraea sp. SD6-2 TaxID=1286093 RepID=UPI000330485C|nr:hypothetical protein [Pandoraea sp. SD6-2]EON15334.1 hypothetical protein C266_02576 [Pandoraea sp. SD6-2]